MRITRLVCFTKLNSLNPDRVGVLQMLLEHRGTNMFLTTSACWFTLFRATLKQKSSVLANFMFDKTKLIT